MNKYYRVKISNFMWEEGAILQFSGGYGSSGGYYPIEDIWDNTPANGGEYISTGIVEHPNNSEFFERVYTDDLKGKYFKTLDQMKQSYKEKFK